MQRLLILCLCSLVASGAYATPNSLVQHLSKIKNLTDQQTVSLLKGYVQLRDELAAIGPRAPGMTSARHRLLLSNAYKAYRKDALAHLTPNQYRRWIKVASRNLPQPAQNQIAIGYGDNQGHSVSWATVMWQASQGN